MGRHSQNDQRQRFRDNLRNLIAHQKWTQTEAARRFGLKEVVLRKYLSFGLANLTPTNRPRLEVVCRTFGIPNVEALWGSRLDVEREAHVECDAEDANLAYYLTHLLRDHREKATVVKICGLIEDAFNDLVLGETRPKERARGGSTIDLDSKRRLLSRKRRQKVKSKKFDEE